MPKKLKGGGTFWDFSKSILSQNLLGNIFFQNSHNANKTERGDALVSSGIVCYAGNLVGSVPLAVQFGVFLKFCRTLGRTILVTSDVSKKNTDEKP